MKISPCPHCGTKATHQGNNKPTLSGYIESQVGNFYVHCFECSMIGPAGKDKEDAIALWNRLPRKAVADANISELVKSVDRLLNLDWEDTVRICCPEDVDAVGILNALQSARDAIDGKQFYTGKKEGGAA